MEPPFRPENACAGPGDYRFFEEIPMYVFHGEGGADRVDRAGEQDMATMEMYRVIEAGEDL